MAMVRLELPFGESTAEKLMKIASHPLLSKSEHVPILPPAWGTLYELTKLPPERRRSSRGNKSSFDSR